MRFSYKDILRKGQNCFKIKAQWKRSFNYIHITLCFLPSSGFLVPRRPETKNTTVLVGVWSKRCHSLQSSMNFSPIRWFELLDKLLRERSADLLIFSQFKARQKLSAFTGSDKKTLIKWPFRLGAALDLKNSQILLHSPAGLHMS